MYQLSNTLQIIKVITPRRFIPASELLAVLVAAFTLKFQSKIIAVD